MEYRQIIMQSMMLTPQPDTEDKGCKYFIRGMCKRGDHCPFRHIKPNKKTRNEARQWLKFCKMFRNRVCEDRECSLLHISPEDEHLYLTTGIISENALGQTIRKALVLDVPLNGGKPACKDKLNGQCNIMNCPFRHFTQIQFSREVLRALRKEFDEQFGPCFESVGAGYAQDDVIHKLLKPVQEVPETLPILQQFPTGLPHAQPLSVWPAGQLFESMQPTQMHPETSGVTDIDKVLMDKLKLANQQITKENKKYLEYIDALEQENSLMLKALDPAQLAVDLDDVRRRLMDAFEAVHLKSKSSEKRLENNTQDYQHKKSTEVAPEETNQPIVEPQYPSVVPQYPNVPTLNVPPPTIPSLSVLPPSVPSLSVPPPTVPPVYPNIPPSYPSVPTPYLNLNLQGSVPNGSYTPVTQIGTNTLDDVALHEDNYESDPMEVEYPENDDQSSKLFVGSLNYKTNEEALKSYFEQYGVVEQYFIKRDKKKKKSKGYGFVVFSDASVVKTVLKKSKHMLDGKELTVRRAEMQVPKKKQPEISTSKKVSGKDKNEEEDEVFEEEEKEVDELVKDENEEVDELDEDESQEPDEGDNEKNNEITHCSVPTEYPIPITGDAPWNKTFKKKKKDVEIQPIKLDWAFARHLRQTGASVAALVQNEDTEENLITGANIAAVVQNIDPEGNPTAQFSVPPPSVTGNVPWCDERFSVPPPSITDNASWQGSQYPDPAQYAPPSETGHAPWSDTQELRNVQLQPPKEGVFDTYLRKVIPKTKAGVFKKAPVIPENTQDETGQDMYMGRLFIRGENKSLDPQIVSEYFKKYGKTIEMNICRKKFGFITYVCLSSANQVLQEAPHMINGSEVTVQLAGSRPIPAVREEDQVEFKNDKYKIFIAGINAPLNKASVEEYFRKYGEITHIKCRKMYGFITFAKTTAVEEVLLNRPHTVDDFELFVRQAEIRNESINTEEDRDDEQSRPDRVYVSGLDVTTTENELHDYFSSYGDIQVDIKKNRKGVSRGFGFITFGDPAAAADVISNSPFTIGDSSVIVRAASHNVKKPTLQEQVEPPPIHDKVYLGGLNKTTTEIELQDYFSVFGEIKSVEIKKKNKKGASRGFGFIAFYDPAAAKDVVSNSPYMIGGNSVEAKPPAHDVRTVPKKEIPLSRSRLYIGGLNANTTESELQDYFTPYGEIQCVEIKRNKKGVSRGFGFITFCDHTATEDVVSNSPFMIGGNSVEVKMPTDDVKKPSNKYLQIQGSKIQGKRALDDENTEVKPAKKKFSSVPVEEIEEKEYLSFAKSLGFMEEIEEVENQKEDEVEDGVEGELEYNAGDDMEEREGDEVEDEGEGELEYNAGDDMEEIEEDEVEDGGEGELEYNAGDDMEEIEGDEVEDGGEYEEEDGGEYEEEEGGEYEEEDGVEGELEEIGEEVEYEM